MKTILFQGDSITDVDRNREQKHDLGKGYALMTAAQLGRKYPGEYQFFNRGISGNRTVDLFSRWRVDCLNIKPDYISILIGVNDVWHEFYEEPNGVDAEKYEKVYDMIIEETLEKLPGVKIMIMEPYVLHGPATDGMWEEFEKEVKLRSAASKRIAEKYKFPFISLQSIFDEAVKNAPDLFWSADGVHPTAQGHQLITEAWIEKFESELK